MRNCMILNSGCCIFMSCVSQKNRVVIKKGKNYITYFGEMAWENLVFHVFIVTMINLYKKFRFV